MFGMSALFLPLTMSPEMTHRKVTTALTTACALMGMALAPQVRPQEDQAKPAYEIFKVAEGAFEAQATLQGRYTAESLGHVSFDAERYAGELLVAEVLVTHGKVDAGQVVLKLEAPDMAEQLDDAREALYKAKLKYEWAQKESKIAEADRAVAAERRKLSLADTLSAHKRWDAFGKADAYQQAELQMQAREDRFADDTQELKQLEELYDGAKLASRTQDVVLGRARRSLKSSKQYLEIARRSHKVQMQETLPNQQRDMDNALRWMQAEYKNAAWREQVAAIQQEWSLDAARDAFDDADEALAELAKDADLLEIKAEQAGVMTRIGLKTGDKAQAGQVFANVFDPSKGTIKASLSAKDLRVVKEGDSVEVAWQWFDEFASTGKVTHIAWQGQASGAAEASYDVTIEVDKVAEMIRPGMKANITATRSLGDKTISVPKDSVASDDQGAYCMVQVGGDFERRAVSVGAGNAERVQIIKGLSVGDAIRVPAK